MSEPVRAIIMPIPQASLLEYLTGRRALSNVPADAEIRSAWIYTRNGTRSLDAEPQWTTHLVLRLEHSSFAPVAEGGRIPVVNPRFRRLAQ